VVTRAHQMGGIALKFRTPPRVGAPDRIIILHGPRIGWIETKHPDGGRDEPGQPRYHAMLQAYGCAVFKCKTRREVDDALAKIAALPPMKLLPPFVLDELLR
jgi:hypothetical protein